MSASNSESGAMTAVGCKRAGKSTAPLDLGIGGESVGNAALAAANDSKECGSSTGGGVGGGDGGGDSMALRNAAFDAARAASRSATSCSVAAAEIEWRELDEPDDEGATLDGGTNPTMAGSSPPIDIMEVDSTRPR